MLINFNDELVYIDEDKEEYPTTKIELPEELWQYSNKDTFDIVSNDVSLTESTKLIMDSIGVSVDDMSKAIELLLVNTTDLKAVSWYMDRALFKGKYRVKVSYIPLPNRPERVKQYMSGDLFGDYIALDIIRIDLYSAKMPRNVKKDLPIWKILFPILISKEPTSNKVVLYDTSGAKAYENMAKTVNLTDIIDLPMKLMITVMTTQMMCLEWYDKKNQPKGAACPLDPKNIQDNLSLFKFVREPNEPARWDSISIKE